MLAWDGLRVESLAVAMAAAQGLALDKIDPAGRDYLRRSANAVLHRLGGEDQAIREGSAHLLEVLADVIETGEAEVAFGHMSEDMVQAMGQLRLIAKVLAGIEPLPAPAAAPEQQKAPASEPAEALEVEEEGF